MMLFNSLARLASKSQKLNAMLLVAAVPSTALLISACGPHDEAVRTANRLPRSSRTVTAATDQPEWVYDAPSYTRPVDEPKPVLELKHSEPLHYFINEHTVHIRRPGGDNAMEIPRIAVFTSRDGGLSWSQTGYFGRGQTFFPFIVDADGEFAVRFVGPGSEPSTDMVATPDRIYHVDTRLPAITALIDTSDAEITRVGETVTLTWSANDANLVEQPIQVSISADGGEWNMLSPDMPIEGSLAYTIPAAFENNEIQFRLEVIDRAGNVGICYSPVIMVRTAETTPDSLITDGWDLSDLEGLAGAPADGSEIVPNIDFTIAAIGANNAASSDTSNGVEYASYGEIIESTQVARPNWSAFADLDWTGDRTCESLLPLVSPLPALVTDDADMQWNTCLAARQWFVLGAEGNWCQTVWSLPKPKLLSDLNDFLDQQIRDAFHEIDPIRSMDELDLQKAEARLIEDPDTIGVVTP